VCILTPHSRAEQESAYGDRSGRDDLDRARRGWVQLTQGPDRHVAQDRLAVRRWRRRTHLDAHQARWYLERIYGVAERLADTGVEVKRGGR
jgi:hypothetical protein